MVYDQDRFGMIEMFGKLLWSHALSFRGKFLAAGRIFSADQIKKVVDQTDLIVQQSHVGIQEKLLKTLIGVLFLSAKSKAGKDGFIQIMISIAAVSAVSTLQTGEDLGRFLWVADGMKFIVKGISGDHDQIRLQFVDAFHQASEEKFVRIVAKVQIGDQGDPKSRMTVTGFMGNNTPFCSIKLPGMKKTVNAEKQDTDSGKKAGEGKHPSGVEPGSFG